MAGYSSAACYIIEYEQTLYKNNNYMNLNKTHYELQDKHIDLHVCAWILGIMDVSQKQGQFIVLIKSALGSIYSVVFLSVKSFGLR